jgi:hypothetical protein
MQRRGCVFPKSFDGRFCAIESMNAAEDLGGIRGLNACGYLVTMFNSPVKVAVKSPGELK